MTKNDPFGLKREVEINRIGVREVFTPHQPIQTVDLFFGRQKEVQKILEHINTPGQHSLLYGERGVGKSSLANIATKVLISDILQGKLSLSTSKKSKLYTKRCDSTDNFLSIMAEPLKDFGIEINMKSMTKSLKQDGKASIGIPGTSAGIESERTATRTYDSEALSPSAVAKALEDKHGLLYVDEVDRIEGRSEKNALAEFIKILSDSGSKFKMLIVGVADTAEELTDGHHSVQRCLKETRLRRMTDDELRLIVIEGAKKIGFSFAEDVIDQIVEMSSGYPHFTHLLALKSAEEAISSQILRTSRPRTVDADCLSRALESAVEDSESTLHRWYLEATRSSNTDMYRIVLYGASKFGGVEFSSSRLRDEIERITGESITQGSLNNYLQRLVANDYSMILHRVSKGVYNFSDPRMPSFVKISSGDLRRAEVS